VVYDNQDYQQHKPKRRWGRWVVLIVALLIAASCVAYNLPGPRADRAQAIAETTAAVKEAGWELASGPIVDASSRTDVWNIWTRGWDIKGEVKFGACKLPIKATTAKPREVQIMPSPDEQGKGKVWLPLKDVKHDALKQNADDFKREDCHPPGK
jgi:hypothetical protein